MIVAVASGKGGTGKTTVAASLIAVWDAPVAAADLDVEAPNLHLFLKPAIQARKTASLEVPVLNEAACSLCRKCAELCQFKAVSVLGATILVFPEMCHGCGGCLAACPENALSPGRRDLGEVEAGTAGRAAFLMGRLRLGEAMSPPLIRAVRADLKELLAVSPRDAVLDAPPGVSCPAMCAVEDADVVLLAAESTPFGFHDFKLAVEAFAPLGKPLAAVINRVGLGDDSVDEFCKANGLPVLARIPFDRSLAEAYARGEVIANTSPERFALFAGLRDALRRLAAEAPHA